MTTAVQQTTRQANVQRRRSIDSVKADIERRTERRDAALEAAKRAHYEHLRQIERDAMVGIAPLLKELKVLRGQV